MLNLQTTRKAYAMAQRLQASRGTGFERAADLILIPLLDTVSGRQPSVENDYTGCPGWATAG